MYFYLYFWKFIFSVFLLSFQQFQVNILLLLCSSLSIAFLLHLSLFKSVIYFGHSIHLSLQVLHCLFFTLELILLFLVHFICYLVIVFCYLVIFPLPGAYQPQCWFRELTFLRGNECKTFHSKWPAHEMSWKQTRSSRAAMTTRFWNTNSKTENPTYSRPTVATLGSGV